MNHSLYSPDLAPRDFLFSKLKMKLKGHVFNDINNIPRECTPMLEATPKIEFEWAFKSLLNHCKMCIEAGREHFE